MKNKKSMTQSCSQGDSKAVDFLSLEIQQKHMQLSIKENTFKNIRPWSSIWSRKMFHVSSLFVPKREEMGGCGVDGRGGGGMERGKSEGEEGSVLTFAINLGH